MNKLTFSNNQTLDTYRTAVVNKSFANNLPALDQLNKDDAADEVAYKRGEDTYIAIGRGDLRGVKVGDKVNVDGQNVDVLYVSNKLNTKAELGNKDKKMALVAGSLIGACAAGLGAVIVGGPVAIAAGAIGGLVLGSAAVYAQIEAGLKGEPHTIWSKLK